MGSNKCLTFLGLLLAVALLISSEVKARELAENSINQEKEQVHHPNGVENPDHEGGRGPYEGGHGGRYEGGHGGHYGGGAHGGCRWGCCGGGWHCRCCTYTEVFKN